MQPGCEGSALEEPHLPTAGIVDRKTDPARARKGEIQAYSTAKGERPGLEAQPPSKERVSVGAGYGRGSGGQHQASRTSVAPHIVA